jgi:hypothetical protein
MGSHGRTRSRNTGSDALRVLRPAPSHEPTVKRARPWGLSQPLTGASGGGLRLRDGARRRAELGECLRWKPGHPARHRPRTSRADQATVAKVVQSWSAPPSPPWPGPLPGGWDEGGRDDQARGASCRVAVLTLLDRAEQVRHPLIVTFKVRSPRHIQAKRAVRLRINPDQSTSDLV